MEKVPTRENPGPLNPAAQVLSKVGGARVVARWRGLTLSGVHKWTYPREKGGTGGLIPADQQLPILIDARRAGIDLTPDDFFHLPDGLPVLGTPANDNHRPAANDNHALTVPAAGGENHARDGGQNAQQSRGSEEPCLG